MFACALYVGMLLLAPTAGCDVVIPVFDCVMDLSVLVKFTSACFVTLCCYECSPVLCFLFIYPITNIIV